MNCSQDADLREADLQVAEKFYRKGLTPAHMAIQAFLRDSPLIVHGARAINAYLPAWLDKDTKDWDILTKGNAENVARALEQKLDKRYGGDFFSVKPGVHPGTFRVWSKVSGDVVADITLQDRQVEFHKLKGINYASLEYHEMKCIENIADPEKKHRHNKDADALKRILIFKKLKKKQRAGKQSTSGGGGSDFGGLNSRGEDPSLSRLRL